MEKHIFVFITLFNLMIQTFGEFSADDCKLLGFNKANLLCSTCFFFNTYNMVEIGAKCTECCLKDDNGNATGTKHYPKAVLKVCTCKFGTYPQIQAFVKSERPSKYKNLEIKYARGSDPFIHLLDADNNVQEILDIHKWNTESVDEFLATHLSQT